MKKTILLFFCFSTLVFSEQVEKIKVFDFKLGSNIGELGFKSNFVDSPEPFAPKTFYINDNEIRILDIFNKRISKFNLDGDSLGVTKISNFNYLFGNVIGGENLVFIFEINTGLGFFNENGELKFNISRNALSNKTIHELGIFQTENYIFIYNYELEIYDFEGNKVDKNDSLAILQKLNSKENAFDSNESIDIVAKQFANKNNILLDNKLATPDFNKHIELYNLLFKNNYNDLLLNIDDYKYKYLIGFDKDSNSYWTSEKKSERKNFMIILSKYGKILNYFETISNRSRISIAASGDIYYLDVNEKGINLLKTNRAW